MNLLRCTKRPFISLLPSCGSQRRPFMRTIDGTTNKVAVVRGLFSNKVISILKPPLQFNFNPSTENVELHSRMIKMEVAALAVIDATNTKFSLKGGEFTLRLLRDYEFTSLDNPREIEEKLKNAFSQCLLNEIIHVSIQSYLASNGMNINASFVNMLNLKVNKIGYEVFNLRLPLDVAPPTSLLYEIYIK